MFVRPKKSHFDVAPPLSSSFFFFLQPMTWRRAKYRAEGNWKATTLRRGSRQESPQSVVPGGMIGGVVGGGGCGGRNGGGPVGVSAVMATATAAAAAAAAAAANVPAPWFPQLVKKMETRKNEATQNLIKSQQKVCRSDSLNVSKKNESIDKPRLLADTAGAGLTVGP